MDALRLLLSAALAISCSNSNDARSSDTAPSSEVTSLGSAVPTGENSRALPTPSTLAIAPASDANAPAAAPASTVPGSMRLVVSGTELRRSQRRAVDRLAGLLKRKSVVTHETSTPEETAFLAAVGADTALPASWATFESVLLLGPGVVAVFHPPHTEPVYLERSLGGLAISEHLASIANALKPDRSLVDEEVSNDE